jgi:hypothetical protein
MEMLERGLDKARSEFCVIDVAAEPGMGKSRLLHEFRQRIGKDRAFVLSGSSSPDGQPGEAEKDVTQKVISPEHRHSEFRSA